MGRTLFYTNTERIFLGDASGKEWLSDASSCLHSIIITFFLNLPLYKQGREEEDG